MSKDGPVHITPLAGERFNKEFFESLEYNVTITIDTKQINEIIEDVRNTTRQQLLQEVIEFVVNMAGEYYLGSSNSGELTRLRGLYEWLKTKLRAECR